MVKERQDITGSIYLKGVPGKVIVDKKGIKDSWKEYMEKLMNEENEWDHRIATTVKEGPADCVRIDEVAAALKQMKRITKEGCIPEDWKSSMVIPIYKGKGDPMECGSYRDTAMDCTVEVDGSIVLVIDE